MSEKIKLPWKQLDHPWKPETARDRLCLADRPKVETA